MPAPDVRGQGRSYGWLASGSFSDPAEIERMRAASRERHAAMFTWEKVLGEYEVGVLESGSRWKTRGGELS